jgi:phospholipid/cholesterol/gamma-HCH transport system permease protein
MVSISIIREILLLPLWFVLGALVPVWCWTRIRVTEQIDAKFGTNPFKYLVVTRIMATTLMLPILVFWDAIALSDRIWLKI